MKKNTQLVVIVVFAILTFLLGGFIVYDKVLKKDNNDIVQNECNCPICTSNGPRINSLMEFKLTNDNQIVKVGNKELKLRRGTFNDKDDILFINDNVVSNNYRRSGYVGAGPKEVEVDAYVTDRFVIFLGYDQYGYGIRYAFGENGKQIGWNENGYVFSDLKLNDGVLTAKGTYCEFIPTGTYEGRDTFKENWITENVIFKYIDNTIIIVKANN